MAFLETELEDLDDCMVDFIHEIVPTLINEKGKSSSYSSDLSDLSDSSDSVEIIEVRKQKVVPYKQRRKARPKKVKIKKAISSSK